MKKTKEIEFKVAGKNCKFKIPTASIKNQE